MCALKVVYNFYDIKILKRRIEADERENRESVYQLRELSRGKGCRRDSMMFIMEGREEKLFNNGLPLAKQRRFVREDQRKRLRLKHFVRSETIRNTFGTVEI